MKHQASVFAQRVEADVRPQLVRGLDLRVIGSEKRRRFHRVVRVGFGRTEIRGLKLNAGRGSIREKPHRAFYSIYVEAFK